MDAMAKARKLKREALGIKGQDGNLGKRAGRREDDQRDPSDAFSDMGRKTLRRAAKARIQRPGQPG